ncbi:MAG: hypothetical protein AABY53_03610 [Bdellovibrionota bacterium]
MKIRPLKITFESIDDFSARSRKELKEVLKNRKPIAQPKDTLIWASVESYQQFMSDQKYTIIATIHKYNPTSIYQLAKMLNRAQQNVARDCELLAGHGFIKFEETENGRKTKAPRLIFNYNAIEVHLPSVTYKVEFEKKAA